MGLNDMVTKEQYATWEKKTPEKLKRVVLNFVANKQEWVDAMESEIGQAIMEMLNREIEAVARAVLMGTPREEDMLECPECGKKSLNISQAKFQALMKLGDSYVKEVNNYMKEIKKIRSAASTRRR